MDRIEVTREQQMDMLGFYSGELAVSMLFFVGLGFLLLAVLYVSTLGLDASSVFIYVLYRVFCATLAFAAVILLRVVLGAVDCSIVRLGKFRVMKSRDRRLSFRNGQRGQVELGQGEYAIYAKVGMGRYYLCTKKL